MARTILLCLPLLVAGCGDLPRPFQGNPGTAAMRLAEPPPSRLLVDAPPDQALPPETARAWAAAMADALTKAGVPSIAAAPGPGWPGWRLVLSASERGQKRGVALYTVRDPAGTIQGVVHGEAMAEAMVSVPTQAETDRAAGHIADLLIGFETAREQSDPNSLLHRPPRVALTRVTGAPGDGDVELALDMARDLRESGVIMSSQIVSSQLEDADYTIRCAVHVTAVNPATQRVEIEWIVTDHHGQEAGRVAQLNDVPAGLLDHYWGDVAQEAARQAAGGIRQVMSNQLMTHQKRAD